MSEEKSGLKHTKMTRDQFAGLAMQGIIANSSGVCSGAKITDGEIERLAGDSYRVADAMLKARDTTTE